MSIPTGQDKPTEQRVEWGLRAYIERVAAELGVGLGATTCEVADFASAYIALPHRAPGSSARDTALIWDQRHGWALAAETDSEERISILAYQRGNLVPPPAQVAGFVETVLAGPPSSPAEPPRFNTTELRTELAAYENGPPAG